MKELKKHKQGRIILLLLGMFLAGILYSCSQPSPGTEVSSNTQKTGNAGRRFFRSQKPLFRMRLLIVRGKKLLFQRQSCFGGRNPEEEQIWIHVCGQVAAPGVYSLNAGSRVFQALEAAGGVLEQGDGNILNLAMVLEDGMRIEFRIGQRQSA